MQIHVQQCPDCGTITAAGRPLDHADAARVLCGACHRLWHERGWAEAGSEAPTVAGRGECDRSCAAFLAARGHFTRVMRRDSVTVGVTRR